MGTLKCSINLLLPPCSPLALSLPSVPSLLRCGGTLKHYQIHFPHSPSSPLALALTDFVGTPTHSISYSRSPDPPSLLPSTEVVGPYHLVYNMFCSPSLPFSGLCFLSPPHPLAPNCLVYVTATQGIGHSLGPASAHLGLASGGSQVYQAKGAKGASHLVKLSLHSFLPYATACLVLGLGGKKLCEWSI